MCYDLLNFFIIRSTILYEVRLICLYLKVQCSIWTLRFPRVLLLPQKTHSLDTSRLRDPVTTETVVSVVLSPWSDKEKGELSQDLKSKSYGD